MNILRFGLSLLISLLIIQPALAQSVVEEEISLLSKEAQNADAQISEHLKNCPKNSSKELHKQINALAKAVERMNNDSTIGENAVQRLQADISELEKQKKLAMEWEQKKMELEKLRQDIGRDILVLSKLYNVETATDSTQKAISKAKEEYRYNIRANVAGFAAYVVSINTLAKEKAAGYNLQEGLVLLDKKNNTTFTRNLRGGFLNLGLVTGGILAYDAFEREQNGTAFAYFIAGLAMKGADLYFTGKDALNDRLNAKRTYDAMIRNALYGDIIREDSANVMKLKSDADSLFRLIEPHIGTHADSVFIKDDWVPSMAILNLAETVLNDMKTNIYYWERIITESDFILNNFRPSPSSKRKLKNIKNSAQSAISSWVFLSEQFSYRITFLKEVNRQD